MEIQAALYEVFTDDPINWIKWVIVFGVLIIGYIVTFPFYKKVSYFLSYKRKQDIAMSRNHIIKAKRIKSYVIGDSSERSCRGTYTYTIDGKEKEYRAIFRNTKTAPIMLNLYYVDSPKKLFSMDEYRWQNHKGIVLLFVMSIPWILAISAMLILKIDLNV